MVGVGGIVGVGVGVGSVVAGGVGVGGRVVSGGGVSATADVGAVVVVPAQPVALKSKTSINKILASFILAPYRASSSTYYIIAQ